jgi:mannosyltransferase OCH1-like enzyme
MELVISEIKKVAIFNSLQFHNEMYGYILNYAKNNNKHVDIYSDNKDNLAWSQFYELHFKNFSIIPVKDYNPNNDYEYVFLTTDSDWGFNSNWFFPNVVVINHNYKAYRNPFSIHYINISNFKDSQLDYVIPCYPICNASNKLQNNIIAVVGGHEISIYRNKYNIDLFNRLKFYNDKPIELHFISQSINKEDLQGINPNINIFIHQNISTIEMDNILREASYIILSSSDSIPKREAETSSGAIQLAYNYLCKPIISKYTNKFLKLKGAYEYDEYDKNDCLLDDVDFFYLQKCRDDYINYFPIALDNLKRNLLIPKKIMQTWETKDLTHELQQIVDSWKIYNPDYEYILFDKYDRVKFIEERFSAEILDAYNSIIPGAYKSDLFRYCYLYVYGGIYVDIDTICLGKLNNFLIPNISFIAPIDLNTNEIDGDHNIACGFIASRPKNHIFLKCIDMILENIKSKQIPHSKLAFSGPGILGRAVNIHLGNNEYSSFVNKQGIIKDCLLLKFEPNTEEVKDCNNNLLFQNKNGNPMIDKFYTSEFNKITDYVSWVTTNKIIKDDLSIHSHVALMIYGQFRTYKYNLRQNILALWPFFEDKIIHVFILSDMKNDGNYSLENEQEIKSIFNEFNFIVEFFQYVEHVDVNSNDENTYCYIFNNSVKHRKGIANEFVPNLMYRHHLLNKLTNQYIETYNIHIDIFCYARLFDIQICPLYYKYNVTYENIQNKLKIILKNNKNIIGASDVMFIGSKDGLTYLFNNWKDDKTIKLLHDDIWNNVEANRFLYTMDSALTQLQHTYSLEIQYLSRIYFSNFIFLPIRLDINNPINCLSSVFYSILHDPNRFENNNNKMLIIDLSKDTIMQINSNITDSLNVVTNNELTHIINTISYQLNNTNVSILNGSNYSECILFTRFHHFNDRRIVVYSFNECSNNQDILHNNIRERPIKVCSENIFTYEGKVKYKHFLLSSKLVYINIILTNETHINNFCNWLLEQKFQGLIIYYNYLDYDFLFDNTIQKYVFKMSSIQDNNIGFIKFSS